MVVRGTCCCVGMLDGSSCCYVRINGKLSINAAGGSRSVDRERIVNRSRKKGAALIATEVRVVV